MDSLDYTLSRLEARSVQDAWPPPSSSEYSHQLSQKSLLSHYERTSGCPSSCCCRTILGIIIFLLILWGAAVPVFFIFGPGLTFNKVTVPPTITHAQPLVQERRPLLDTEPNVTVQNAVNVTMRLVKQPGNPQLYKRHTVEHHMLKLKLETMIKVIFDNNEEFNKATITGFRLGSHLTFVLMFHKNQHHIRDLVETTLLTYLTRHWDRLGPYVVDVTSVRVQYLQNRCALDNGGCSHLCFWSILGSGFECRCPKGYTLLTDRTSCFPAGFPKQTTSESRCRADEFGCYDGSCISSAWTCDDVSDCVMGEDENMELCKDLPKRTRKHRMESVSTQKGKTDINRADKIPPVVIPKPRYVPIATLPTQSTLAVRLDHTAPENIDIQLTRQKALSDNELQELRSYPEILIEPIRRKITTTTVSTTNQIRDHELHLFTEEPILDKPHDFSTRQSSSSTTAQPTPPPQNTRAPFMLPGLHIKNNHENSNRNTFNKYYG